MLAEILELPIERFLPGGHPSFRSAKGEALAVRLVLQP